MDDTKETAVRETPLNERLESIYATTECTNTRKFKCVNHVRDLPEIILDEPRYLGGEDAGATPLEIGLCAFNSCTAMTINVLRREMRLKVGSIRLETSGVKDVRTAEARRTGKKFSEVVPVAYHYYKITQKVFIKTSEDEESIAHLRSEAERLCPYSALFRDAGVDVETIWVRED